MSSRALDIWLRRDTAGQQQRRPKRYTRARTGARAAILDCEASICNRELAAAPTPPRPPSRWPIIAQVEECAPPSVSGWQTGLERHARARPGARAAILDCEASICHRELAAAPTPPRPSQCVESRLSAAERVHPTIGTVAHSTPRYSYWSSRGTRSPVTRTTNAPGPSGQKRGFES